MKVLKFIAPVILAVSLIACSSDAENHEGECADKTECCEGEDKGDCESKCEGKDKADCESKCEHKEGCESEGKECTDECSEECKAECEAKKGESKCGEEGHECSEKCGAHEDEHEEGDHMH